MSKLSKIPNYKCSPFDFFRRKNLGMRFFWLTLYYFIAVKLPNQPLPGSILATYFRRFCVSKIFKRVGHDITVHGDVYFGSGADVELGDYSSLNYGCWISNDTVIGDDVMMGPVVMILSGRHNF